MLAGYAFINAREAALWSNPVQQIAVWSQAHPHSLRGQIIWGWLLSSSGREEDAEKIYRHANADYQGDPFLMIKGLALRCAAVKTLWPQEDDLFAHLRTARYSKTVLLSMEEVVNKAESGHCPNIQNRVWIKVLDTLLGNRQYAPSHYLFWFFRARLLATDGQIDEAIQSIDKALAVSPNLSYYTYPIFWLISANRPEEASKYLARARMTQESQGIDGILYKPVLDEWDTLIRKHLHQAH